MPHLRGSVLLLLVSAVLASRALSDAGSGSVVSEAGSGSVVSEAGSGSVVSEASPPTSPPPTSPSSSGAVVASTPSYQTALDQLYAQVDLDPTDGSLSQAEYDAAVVKLGIGSESPFNDASFFSTLDADGSGGLSQAEIISYFSAHTGEVQKAIDALAGVPSGDDAFSFKPSAKIKDARSSVEYSVIVSAELSSIFPGDRQRMRADVAALVGVKSEQVVATFLNTTSSGAARRLVEATLASPVWQRMGPLAAPASASARASVVGREPSLAHARRRLSASVRASFVVFVKDEAAAAAVVATLRSKLGSAAAASSLLGLSVTGLPTVTSSSVVASSLAMTDLVLAGGGLAACVVLLCCCCAASTLTARRRRRKTAEAYAGNGKCGRCGRGCRRNGCLSFHALKASIGCELVAVLFALGALALLYLKANPLKPSVGKIIDELANLKNSTGRGKEAYDNFGKELDPLQEVRPYVDYLDMAVVAPGAVAALLMLLAACCSLRSRGWPCCPCGPCKRRRFVLPKCCICLGGAFLLLGLALYAGFAAVGLSSLFPVTIGVDFTAQRALRSTLGLALCDTALPQLRQLLADAAQAVTNAEAVGGVPQSDIDTRRADLSAATADMASFDGMCAAFDKIEGAATSLFGVGFLCVCALLFGLVANSGLCCVLKCCWNPVRSGRVAPADDNAGTMMQPLVPSALEGEKPGSAGAPAPESRVPPKIPPPAVKGAWTE